MRSRSPIRNPGSSRPHPMSPLTPGMNRGHLIPQEKEPPHIRSWASPERSLSHHKRSPVFNDRAHAKYDEPRRSSPVRHLGPTSPRRPRSPHGPRDMSPYVTARYQSSALLHSERYSPPVRKKLPRSPSVSPPPRHSTGPVRSDDYQSRRAGDNRRIEHDQRIKHAYDMQKQSSPDMASDLKRKIAYVEKITRYQSSSDRYKDYATTLDQRFSSVVQSSRTEPRVQYSKEDLEKITMSIRRNTQEPDHHHHSSVDKFLHHTSQGHQARFEREDVYKKASAYKEYSRSDAYHRIHPDDHVRSSSRHSTSDRWPAYRGRKKSESIDRDDIRDYKRTAVPRVYERSRSRSADRDFRSGGYKDERSSSNRSGYSPRRQVTSSTPYPHPKSAVPVIYRKSDKEVSSRSIRTERKHHSSPEHFSERFSRGERKDYRSSAPEPPRYYKSRSPSREKLAEHLSRSDKYNYRPERKYFERPKPRPSPMPEQYENEQCEPTSTFRGGGRPFHSPRGFRGRGFRGALGATPRGSFRGSFNPRGRGFSRS